MGARTSWTWTKPALRIAAGIQALLVVVQAALAGQFLSGNRAAREFHREIGTELITWMSLATLVLAVLAWRPGGNRAWPIPLMGIGLPAVILQLGYGFDSRLDFHLPLGIGIFALYLIVLVGFKTNSDDQGE